MNRGLPWVLGNETFSIQLKKVIHPENLRILPGREIRVAVHPVNESFCQLWPDLREAYVSTYAPAAVLTRECTELDFLWHRNHENGLLEFPELWYDVRQLDVSWAIQRTDLSGQKNFTVKFSTESMGLVHQIDWNVNSEEKAFVRFVEFNQTDYRTEHDGQLWQGFNAMIQDRYDRWQKRMDIVRRVDRCGIADFLSQLCGVNGLVRLTLINKAIKHSCDLQFTSSVLDGETLEMLNHKARFVIQCDRIYEAYIIQCQCACGEEILEMYDCHQRLIASIAYNGLSQSTAKLLPALN
tara:strand:+ start:2107 stop:2994 length:888 start_codon:yes stop_codon:yes gene_type:complete